MRWLWLWLWQGGPWWVYDRLAAIVRVTGIVLLPAWQRLLVHPGTVVATVDCRKDRGLRATWRLTLPTHLVHWWAKASLLLNWEATLLLLNHGVACWIIGRLASHGWISSLHRWLISWMPGSFCWPKCLLPGVSLLLLPGVTKIRLLLPTSWRQAVLLLPTASSFKLLRLPGLSLHLATWHSTWHKLHVHLTLPHLGQHPILVKLSPAGERAQTHLWEWRVLLAL